MKPEHISVLLPEVMELLAPKEGESVLDVTLGLGGHSAEFLKRIGKKGHLVALDADTDNLQTAKLRLAFSANQTTLIHANFRQIPDCLENQKTFDIIFADLGLSSPHIDDPSRGFTFRADAPLDMRFDRTYGRTAADILAQETEVELKKIFQDYGELPRTNRFVEAIIDSRRFVPPKTTTDLKKLVDDVFSYKAASVLPQIFQALRIAVNDEIGALEHLLMVAPTLLKPGGRLGVISYHSLEDRLVKQTFRTLTTAEKDELTGAESAPAPFELLTKKPIGPDEAEEKANPRSRSAKLRGIVHR